MESLLLNELLNSTKDYIKNKESINLIKKAFFIAEKYHNGQYRKAGDHIPYITHPVGVAIILSTLKAGPQTLVAALLHDTLEDTTYTKELMIQDFGEEIYNLVYAVTKIGRLKFKTDLSQAEYHRKMLLATATDIRVILIKIADRLHNIRTLEELPDDRRKAISNETLEIYAPLAHRLGLFAIKAELEDTSLKYNDPKMFYHIYGLLEQEKRAKEKSIEDIIKEIKSFLEKYKVNAYSIKGRTKNINSIYKKMVIQKKDFEDIYDLLAIRIIVSDIETCYKVLGIIHAQYSPIPKRFKDYIAMPKPNMYQSLHTTVISKDGSIFEVQIRTEEMDKVAEYGIAAHWSYKESAAYSKEKEQFEMAEKMKWYADLLKMSTDEKDSDKDDPISFVQEIKTDILLANVYVFTPEGKVIELPQGSTPIDFAYRIHTEVGNKMIGCLINNKIATINTELKTGDIVSIKTGKTGGPNLNWLKICKSNYSRNKIKNFLNKKNYSTLVEQGKLELEKEMEKHGITDFPTDKFIKENFEKQNYQTLEQIFAEIAKGNLSEKTVVAKIIGKKDEANIWLNKQIEKTKKINQTHKQNQLAIIIPGLIKPKVKLANCCHPIFGDEIKGFVAKNGGIVIHNTSCKNLSNMQTEREVEVLWGENKNRKYETTLIITATDNDKALPLVINQFSINKVSISEIKTSKSKELGSFIKIKILVYDVNELTQVIANLRKINKVINVIRVMQ